MSVTGISNQFSEFELLSMVKSFVQARKINNSLAVILTLSVPPKRHRKVDSG